MGELWLPNGQKWSAHLKTSYEPLELQSQGLGGQDRCGHGFKSRSGRYFEVGEVATRWWEITMKPRGILKQITSDCSLRRRLRGIKSLGLRLWRHMPESCMCRNFWMGEIMLTDDEKNHETAVRFITSYEWLKFQSSVNTVGMKICGYGFKSRSVDISVWAIYGFLLIVNRHKMYSRSSHIIVHQNQLVLMPLAFCWGWNSHHSELVFSLHLIISHIN